MRRREFIALLGAAVMVPLRASAQAPKHDKLFRIATLPDLRPETRGWFSDAMRDLGWAEGREFIVVESRLLGLSNSEQQLDDAIRRVLADKPDLILTTTTAYALTAHRATTTTPIVMLTSGYPVEAGLADSLSRPGKNVTGNAVYAGFEVWGKLLQLLRDVQPGIKRVSVLWTYVPPAFPREEIEPGYAELRNAERLLGLRLHIVEAANADQVSAALAEIEVESPDALLLAGGLTFQVVSSVIQFAVKKRLPSIADWSSWPTALVEPYPLLSYGPALRELIRSTAASIDKVMRGTKPGELPIQQPARFELVLNLQTARRIGLTIPTDLLLRADKIIE